MLVHSWIYHNTDLVVSICICGVVLTIIGLVLVWWWLKRKHGKAMAAKEAAEAAEEGQAGGAGSDTSVFKGEWNDLTRSQNRGYAD